MQKYKQMGKKWNLKYEIMASLFKSSLKQLMFMSYQATIWKIQYLQYFWFGWKRTWDFYVQV